MIICGRTLVRLPYDFCWFSNPIKIYVTPPYIKFTIYKTLDYLLMNIDINFFSLFFLWEAAKKEPPLVV